MRGWVDRVTSRVVKEGIERSQFVFLLYLTLAVFMAMTEYAITRPASNAFFISLCGSHLFPYVWLATVPLNFLVVYLYNRWLPKLGSLKIFLIISSLIAVINLLSAFFIEASPYLAFFHYAWKDIYILLMFKQIWSLIHATIDSSRSKWLYSTMFGLGSVGSVCGGLLPSFCALSLGSAPIFLFTLPCYVIISICYFLASKRSFLPQKQEGFEKMLFSEGTVSKGGFALFKNSRFLVAILLLVIFMQISISLVTFQFNLHLENEIPSLDLRTQYGARVHSVLNMISTLFQFTGSFFAIQFLGLKRSHFLVPLLLLGNTLLFLFKPTFGMITYLYASIKTADYSFFNIIREMLYSSLKPDEKFRAKAIIDVFAYRSAKAGGAAIVLLLQALSLEASSLITWISLVIFLLWSLSVLWMFASQKQQKTIYER